MNYGYYNYYITDIGEDVQGITDELRKYADEVITEQLSYCPKFHELISNAEAGDTIYVYDIKRSCGGLRDLVDTLKVLYAKGVKFISLMDEITIDNSEMGTCRFETLLLASSLIGADPIHGFYK